MCVHVCTISVFMLKYLCSNINSVLMGWDQMHFGTKVQSKGFGVRKTSVLTQAYTLGSKINLYEL